MVVSDVMSRAVDYVTTNATVKDISRIIFGKSINGVPVVGNGKVVGFVTERDILSKFYPSVQDYIEDPVNTSDFELMEKEVSNILSMKASKIMSRHPVIVTADTPLLKAQSLMFIHKVGRLPVVDENNKLIGIVSKSDIFRAVVGDQIPTSGEEEYHDWLSRHYDLATGWEERLGNEIPDLTKLFKKEKAEKIVDVGCGTGEHDIALAGKGFRVLGIEASPLMHSKAVSKLDDINKNVLEKVEFRNGDYVEVLNSIDDNFDAAIFMGNAFSHIVGSYEQVLKAVAKKISKDGLIFFQINNFYRLFNVKKRFLSLSFAKAINGVSNEFAFLEFYDPARSGSKNFTLNMAVLDSNGKNWRLRSMNSTPILNLDKGKMKKLLGGVGFKKIEIFGADANGSLFEPFDKDKSHYLNILAKR